MKASFFAFDKNGKQVQPSAPDFLLTEDGIPRSVTDVTCPPTSSYQISSVLAIDISGSMATSSNGSTRMAIAQAAASAWVNDLILGPSECAITSFDDNSYINQDFTTDRNKLSNVINSLAPAGGTDYDQGLSEPLTGAIPVCTNSKHKRIIVFLTDGVPNSEPQTQAIIAQAKAANITIYVVCIALGAPNSLVQIATQTGGQWFDNITTVEQAQDIYEKILHMAQGGGLCSITWLSGAGCNTPSSQRNVDIHLTPVDIDTHVFYTPPPSAIFQLLLTPPSLFISSKPAGVKFDTTIIVTAQNSSITVTNITSSNPVFDINPKQFSLASGGSRTLTVSFTPADVSQNWTMFDFQTDLCPQTYYVSGGFPGSKPKNSTLKLVRPNGGEIFPVGSDTDITWSGIPPADTVKLDYSIDSGKTWFTINSFASGLRVPWTVPNTPSKKCLARVRQMVSQNSLGWAKPAGDNTHLPKSVDITADNFGNSYVTGEFTGTVNFGGVSLTSTGNPSYTNTFLIKYLPNGTVAWAKHASNSTGKSVAVDASGNIYLAGSLEDTAIYPSGNPHDTSDFDGIKIPTQSGPAFHDIFLAKYHPDGSIEWAQGLGSYTLWNGANNDCAGVRVDAMGNVYLAGYFYTNSNSSYADFGGIHLFAHDTFYWNAGTVFVAKYHADGKVEWAQEARGVYNGQAGQSMNDEALGLDVDPEGNSYITGRFQGVIDFSGISLTDIQYYEGFIAAYTTDGAIRWARSISGNIVGKNYDDEGNSIAVDASGNSYVLGKYQGSLNFGGINLPATSSSDIFMAKFTSDGTVSWAKSATGNSSIAVDASGNIFTCGPYGVTKYNTNGISEWSKIPSGFAQFDGTPPLNSIAVDGFGFIYTTGEISVLTRNGSFVDTMYTWKMGDETLQSDISDTLFSIVAPKPLSQDIDMKQVLLGSNKDSVITGFIRNTGTYPFAVTSINFFGPNPDEFSIVSGKPPFAVPATGAMPVEFRFTPKGAGLRQAKIFIITQADTLFQNIRGTGIAPFIEVQTPVIDFDSVNVGSQKDSIINITIRNIGTAPITITGTRHLGPNAIDFSTIAGGGSFLLQPNTTQVMTLRFTPSDAGRTSGRLAFDYNGAGSPAIMQLFGTGVRHTPMITSIASVPFGLVLCQGAIDTIIMVSNPGGLPLIISDATITGINASDFKLTGTVSGLSVLPDSSAAIGIRFIPSALGNRLANLVIHSNAVPDSLFTIALSGRKDSIGIVTDIDSIDLGTLCPNAGKDTVITITNTGTVRVGLKWISTGDLNNDPDSTSLSAGDHQVLRLHYSGKASEGTIQGIISFTDSICGRLLRVTITGKVKASTLSVSPPLIDFGAADLCTTLDTSITLSCTGCEPIRISGITGLGSGFGSNSVFPIILEPGESKQVDIFTILDTLAGNKSSLGSLGFISTPSNTLPPLTIIRTYSYPVRYLLSLHGPANASAGETINLELTANTKQLTGCKTLDFDLGYNSDLLGYTPSPGINTSDGKHFQIVGSPLLIPDTSGVLAVLPFKVYLTTDSSTSITLATPHFNIDDPHFEQCIASTTSAECSFNYHFLCGDYYLSSFMRGVLPLNITSLYPNPAQDEIRLELESGSLEDAKIELHNMLGVLLYSSSLHLSKGVNTVNLSTTGICDGVYLIRITDSDGSATQSFVKVK